MSYSRKAHFKLSDCFRSLLWYGNNAAYRSDKCPSEQSNPQAQISRRVPCTGESPVSRVRRYADGHRCALNPTLPTLTVSWPPDLSQNILVGFRLCNRWYCTDLFIYKMVIQSKYV